MPRYVTLEEAGGILAQCDRVLVVGCSGGGKTTLSRTISARFGVEFQSLDRDVRWLPGWKERERQEQHETIRRLALRDRWVMDGSGASTFHLRLPRTDLVLWVRVPRRVALLGVAKRVIRYLGTVRPDMAEGCPEPMPDREFLSYIWNFEKRYAPLFIRNFDLHGPNVPVAILKSHIEMACLVDLAEHARQRSAVAPPPGSPKVDPIEHLSD